MEFSYAQINASGFYFDEVGNKVSSAQLVLTGLSNLAGKTSMNVNVLSHLEMNRIRNLTSGDNPLTFSQAKVQAQEEVLAIFEELRLDEKIRGEKVSLEQFIEMTKYLHQTKQDD